jgi:hypothetical protein
VFVKRCSKYNHNINITQHQQRNLFPGISFIIQHIDNILRKVGKSRFDLYFMLDMNVQYDQPILIKKSTKFDSELHVKCYILPI